MKLIKQKITPFLWFDDNAEEAVKFYVSIFKKSKIKAITYYGEAGPGTKGSVMTVTFEIEGQQFMALNGGSQYKFNESVSFMVHCETQAEVDRYWKKLTAGGKEVACGWLKDKYGLFWQIVPTVFLELISSKDKVKSQRAMEAMMNMVKLDIRKLKQAYNGKTAKNRTKKV
ncbi:MAG TPA: VOC family protein [Verrucomicrobiae bacterium]|jgi:predicted 3-demethylubiquinone-9 3-methyltransferase (glyoxalase superfamily)